MSINSDINTLPEAFQGIKDDEMALSEHVEEFSQRLLFCFLILTIFTLMSFVNVGSIVKIVQAPAPGIKFLQFAPGEYFFASVKIAFFSGLIISSPAILYQLALYIFPAMTKKERDIIIPVTLGSGLLFFLGLGFSYFFLIPAALTFFINYGADIVEPFWSFDQYFDFVAVLIFSTGLTFQVPVIQVLLGLLGVVSGQKMLSYWKYVVILVTIIAAVITPSTDPITQLLLSFALLSLYLVGAGIVVLLKKES